MSNAVTQQVDLVIPNRRERRLAEKSSQVLATHMHADDTYTIQLVENDHVAASTKLPSSAFRLLVDILTEMAAGNSVSLVPVHNELSTQAAADLLGVSRPYIVKLVEEGAIPFHKVGKHRRVYAKDILDYKEKISKAREKTLQKLTEQAQKLDMGYNDE